MITEYSCNGCHVKFWLDHKSVPEEFGERDMNCPFMSEPEHKSKAVGMSPAGHRAFGIVSEI